MKKLHKIAGVLLLASSAWLMLTGFAIAIATSGEVAGSEFGMLITLAGVLGKIAVWLGLFAFWRWTSQVHLDSVATLNK